LELASCEFIVGSLDHQFLPSHLSTEVPQLLQLLQSAIIRHSLLLSIQTLHFHMCLNLG